MYKTVAAINKLIASNKAVFKSGGLEFTPAGNVRSIKITSSTMDVVIVGNFSPSYKEASITFTKTGNWFDYFGNTSVTITNLNQVLFLAPGEFHIYTSVQQPPTEVGLIDFLVTRNTDEIQDSFSIYPNPIKDKSFMIQWTDQLPETINIKAVDMLGRIIRQTTHTPVESLIYYDAQSFTPGVYILLIDQMGKRKTQKIIIE